MLDYLDCVLHVFTPEARERYQLEELWHEAPRLELDLEPADLGGPGTPQAPESNSLFERSAGAPMLASEAWA